MKAQAFIAYCEYFKLSPKLLSLRIPGLLDPDTVAEYYAATQSPPSRRDIAALYDELEHIGVVPPFDRPILRGERSDRWKQTELMDFAPAVELADEYGIDLDMLSALTSVSRSHLTSGRKLIKRPHIDSVLRVLSSLVSPELAQEAIDKGKAKPQLPETFLRRMSDV